MSPVALVLWGAAALLEATAMRLAFGLDAWAIAGSAHVLAVLLAVAGTLRHGRAARVRPTAFLGAAATLFAPPLGLGGALAIALVSTRRRAPLRSGEWSFDDGDAPPAPRRPRARFLPLESALALARSGPRDRRLTALRRIADLGGPDALRELRARGRDADPAVAATARDLAEAAEARLDRELALAISEVRRNPDAPEAHALMATRFSELAYGAMESASGRQHLLEMAVKAYTRALFGLRHRRGEILTELGQTLVRLARLRARRREPSTVAARLRLAVHFLDRACADNPRDPRPLTWALEAAFRVGDAAALRRLARRASSVLAVDPRVRRILAYWSGAAVGSIDPAPLRDAAAAPPPVAIAARVERAFLALRALAAPTRRQGDALLARLRGDDEIEAVARAALRTDDATRVAVVGHLGRVGTHVASRWLCAFLQSDRPWLRASARDALSRVPPRAKVDALLSVLHSAHPAACTLAAQTIGRLGLRGAARPVAWLLDDARPHVVYGALTALTRLRAQSEASAIMRLTQDTREGVRIHAIWALALVSPETASVRLRSALRDDSSPHIRVIAAWALARSPSHRDRAAVASALQTERNPLVLSQLVRGGLGGGRRRSVAALLELARGEHGRAPRRLAELALQKMSGRTVERALRHALARDEADAREAAVRSMSPSTGRQLLSALCRATRDDSAPGLRVAAVEALGRTGDARAAGALEHALAEDDAPLTSAAAHALALLEGGAGLRGLVRALEDARGKAGKLVFPALEGLRRAGALAQQSTDLAEQVSLLLELAVVALGARRAAVRRQAAEAIAAAGAMTAFDPLLAAIQAEADRTVKPALADALARCLDGDPGLLLRRLEGLTAAGASVADPVRRARLLLGGLAAIPLARPTLCRAVGRLVRLVPDLRERGLFLPCREELLAVLGRESGAVLDVALYGPGEDAQSEALRILRLLGVRRPGTERHLVSDRVRSLLGARHPSVREQAARTLGVARDLVALPLLVTCARTDAEPRVRAAAREALATIAAPGGGPP